MKVLLVTPYLFPAGGGLERYADALATELTRQGHEVTQVGFAHEPRYEYERGFRRVHVPFTRRVSNTPVGLGVYRCVKQLLREEPFDVVNGHTPVPGAAESAAWAARRARVPFVATYHAGRLSGGTPMLDAVAWLHRAGLERAMLSNAAGLVAVSPYVRANALAQRDARVVWPGVDVERFHEVEDAIPGRILFLGSVSQAYAWKGFDALFEAFARLAPRVPHAHLRVVGGGDLVPHYVERAKALGISERVDFAGRADEAELPLEYSRAETTVLPSTSDAESFGMVLAEASACARPVVGSRVGGIPCFVEHEANGLLARPGDAADLADAIERVLLDPALAQAMGREGARRVHARHRWDVLAARTLGVYEAAIARSGTRTPRLPAASKPPAPRRQETR